MRNLTRPARTYELMVVLAPDVPEEELPGELDRVRGYIAAAGGRVGEILRDSPWGRRRLAYPIRHAGRDVRDGFYALYHLELEPGLVADVERELRLNDRVIRHLVTTYDGPLAAALASEETPPQPAVAPVAAAEPGTAGADEAEPTAAEAAPTEASAAGLTEAPAVEPEASAPPAAPAEPETPAPAGAEDASGTDGA